MTPDWNKIREDYARGETFSALERKYAVARSTLRGRQRRGRTADAFTIQIPTPI